MRLLPHKHPESPCRTALSVMACGLIALVLGGLLTIAGCAGSKPGAITPPSIAGYEGRRESLAGLNLVPMHGRRVVLDPGHGGFFRGAIGPNGLAEADVNLGVALYLRGLLEWAGAEVWLTRSADTDFLSPQDSTLAGDLASRVALSDSIQPDVFLSLHHNSTAEADPTINETQTYYPLTDDGASRDLALAVHRHLVVNLQIRPASIRPGNFHVLRNATVPAVLGEPAMISHPVMAGRLSLAASQRLEAEAYFLGLLDYFAGGMPAWSGAHVDTVWWGGATGPTTLAWNFLADNSRTGNHEALPGPDPSAIELSLDGDPASWRLSPDARTVTWEIPRGLTAAPHLLEIHGRNLAGRATPPRRTVLLPRAGNAVAVTLTRVPGSAGAIVHWQSLAGGPLPSGTLHLAGDLTFAVSPELAAWQLVPRLAPAGAEPRAYFRSRQPPALARACPVLIDTVGQGQFIAMATRDGHPFAPAAGWRPRQGGSGTGPLLKLADSGPIWLDGAGVQPLVAGPSEDRDLVLAPWPVTAMLPGLVGKVIILDPAGGGPDDEGAGPLGLRGADLNLAVAKQAALLLRGAGAVVHLTRVDETAPTAVAKVKLASRYGANLFLTIGRVPGGESRLIQHHPGSATGRAWAEAAARASALLPAPDSPDSAACRIQASAAYLLRHTACPALSWRLESPRSEAAEILMAQPTWHRAEARAILLAIATISGQPDILEHTLPVADLVRMLAKAGGVAPAEVEWVLVDGNFPWSPLPVPDIFPGAAKSLYSGNGPPLPGLLQRHFLEVHSVTNWQLWRIDRLGNDWRPTLLLADPSQTP